jgi:hypothetical protein
MNLTNRVLINSSDQCYLVLGKSIPKNLYYLQELKTNRLCKCNCPELEQSLQTGLARIVSEKKGSNPKKILRIDLKGRSVHAQV